MLNGEYDKLMKISKSKFKCQELKNNEVQFEALYSFIQNMNIFFWSQNTDTSSFKRSYEKLCGECGFTDGLEEVDKGKSKSQVDKTLFNNKSDSKVYFREYLRKLLRKNSPSMNVPRQINWAELHDKKIQVGVCGEILALNYERKKLKDLEMHDLAMQVKHLSIELGDGLGYDIESYDAKGKKIFIEVKATTGNWSNEIHFTQNELKVMKEKGEHYHLYRVFSLDLDKKTGSIKIYRGYESIAENFDFYPKTFAAKPKEDNFK